MHEDGHLVFEFFGRKIVFSFQTRQPKMILIVLIGSDRCSDRCGLIRSAFLIADQSNLINPITNDIDSNIRH